MKKLNLRKTFILFVLSLGFISSTYAQNYGGGIEQFNGMYLVDLGYMETPTMFVRMRSQNGWQIDPDFTQWANEYLGMLPEAAYHPDGVDISFYMLGHLEENVKMTFKEFLKKDEQNYKKQGINPVYKVVKYEYKNPKFKDKLLDYGVCEIYGLKNSKVEIMFVGKTEKGLIIIFCAAKGNPDDSKVKKLKEDFLNTINSLEIYTRDNPQSSWVMLVLTSSIYAHTLAVRWNLFQQWV